MTDDSDGDGDMTFIVSGS